MNNTLAKLLQAQIRPCSIQPKEDSTLVILISQGTRQLATEVETMIGETLENVDFGPITFKTVRLEGMLAMLADGAGEPNGERIATQWRGIPAAPADSDHR